MNCKKCHRDLPDGSVFCCYCGKKQVTTPKKRAHKRAHGSGTIHKDLRYANPYTAFAPALPNGYRQYIGAFPTYADAQHAIDDFLSRGIVSRGSTFAEVYASWSAVHYNEVSDSAAATYKSVWTRFLPIAHRKIADLRAPDFQAVIDEASSKPTATALRSLAIMVCRYALENDLIAKNYAEFAKIPRFEKTEKKIFTPEQISELWKHTDDVRVQAILVMIYMGFRIGEIHSLTQDHIFFDAGYVVAGEKTEAGINRIIPFPSSIPEISGFVRSWCEAAGDRNQLFTCRQALFRNDFYNVLIQLGMIKGRRAPRNQYIFDEPSHLTPHSTRHTFASLSASAGIKADSLQKIIGHANFSTTANIYVHKDFSALSAEMSKLKK